MGTHVHCFRGIHWYYNTKSFCCWCSLEHSLSEHFYPKWLTGSAFSCVDTHQHLEVHQTCLNKSHFCDIVRFLQHFQQRRQIKTTGKKGWSLMGQDKLKVYRWISFLCVFFSFSLIFLGMGLMKKQLKGSSSGCEKLETGPDHMSVSLILQSSGQFICLFIYLFICQFIYLCYFGALWPLHL